MTDLEDRVDDLKYFVAGWFDGTTSRCLELDQLLWAVRLANRHQPQASRLPEAQQQTWNQPTTITLEDLDL